jgi:hypothetical protein
VGTMLTGLFDHALDSYHQGIVTRISQRQITTPHGEAIPPEVSVGREQPELGQFAADDGLGEVELGAGVQGPHPLRRLRTRRRRQRVANWPAPTHPGRLAVHERGWVGGNSEFLIRPSSPARFLGVTLESE